MQEAKSVQKFFSWRKTSTMLEILDCSRSFCNVLLMFFSLLKTFSKLHFSIGSVFFVFSSTFRGSRIAFEHLQQKILFMYFLRLTSNETIDECVRVCAKEVIE